MTAHIKQLVPVMYFTPTELKGNGERNKQRKGQ